MELVIKVLLLLLLLSSVVFSQSAKKPESWQIVGQVNGDRIEFKCTEGCLWSLNSVTCSQVDQCRWTLDESGISTQADSFDYELELEKGRQDYQRRQSSPNE